MIFSKGGILSRNLAFYYNGNILEIVSRFKYLDMVLTTGESTEAQKTLTGLAQKTNFKLNK